MEAAFSVWCFFQVRPDGCLRFFCWVRCQIVANAQLDFLYIMIYSDDIQSYIMAYFGGN